MRPVLAGHIRYDEIDANRLGLAHFAEVNDAMDIDAENTLRLRKRE